MRAQTQYLYDFDRHNIQLSNGRKIFVGGLPSNLTTEEFKAYFEQFGSIEDVVVMSDKETNRPRGFGFVTFESLEAANNVIKNRFYDLKDKRVEVKKAVSKERMCRNLGNYNFANFGAYSYTMNNYLYGAYYGLGYVGLSYVCYPYQNLYPNYNTNTWPYQNSYDYADNYSYQSPYSSNRSEKYSNRSPVVIKNNLNHKDCDDSDVVENGKVEKGGDHLRQRDSNDEGSVVKDVLESCVGVHGEIIEAVSLYSDGSSKQMEADGQTTDS